MRRYLVAAARAGKPEARDRLARYWHPRLVAHGWRLLGDREAARDCVQQAWIDIWAGLGGLREDAAFAAWAHRIVTRKCAAYRRRRQRETQLASRLATDSDPPAEAYTAHDEGLLAPAMRTLSPDQRAAIALAYGGDMTIAEIAVALDAPEGTIKTRLMHARRKLRAAMDDMEGDLP